LVNLLKPERTKQDPLENRHQPVAILLPPHKTILDCSLPTTLRTAGAPPLQFSPVVAEMLRPIPILLIPVTYPVTSPPDIRTLLWPANAFVILGRVPRAGHRRLKLPLDSRGLISYIMLSIDCGYGLGGGNFDRVPIDTAVSKPGGLGPVTAVVLIVVETWWGGAGGALLARS